MFPQPYNPLDDRRRILSAGGLSIGFHVVVLLFLLFGPPLGDSSGGRRGPEIARLHEATPLVAPLHEFTQKEPNKGPISKEVNAEALQERLKIRSVPSPPPAPKSAFVPPSPGPAPVPQQAMLEPPKAEAPAARTVQLPPLGVPDTPPPPPRIQTEEKPKLAFEKPGASSGIPAGAGRLAPPGSTVQDAMRSAARRPGSAGGVVVGDLESGAGIGEGLNIPPSLGRSRSNLELLSDPQGVDFRPYLARILMSVRRNWLSVIPESAKFSHGGKVIVQFSIARDGRVPKLVIAMPSGADALDRAAVAGISASNPFPPLPSEFKGEQIKVQFSFLYNSR